MIIDMGYYELMPYKDKEKERARGVRRREYFRNRCRNISNLSTPLNMAPNIVGRVGEEEFLKVFPNSRWVGRPYDGECSYGRVDIKTSKPHEYKSVRKCDSGRRRWRFSVIKQRGKVDNFILFCLNDASEIEKVLVVPDKHLGKVTGVTLLADSESKYDKYTIPHI